MNDPIAQFEADWVKAATTGSGARYLYEELFAIQRSRWRSGQRCLQSAAANYQR